MLRARRRTWFASGITGVLAASAVFALVAGSSVLAGSPARAVGTGSDADSSADSSAVTITAKEQDADNIDSAPMPDLAVTVSQTQHLQAQGIRISWTGGKKSIASSSNNGGANFLQIFMCWGDDPEDSSRPDRTTCVYGGANTPGATRDAYRNLSLAQIPEEDRPYTAPAAVSFLPPFTGIPFVARDGARVDAIKTDPVKGTTSIDEAVNLNINEFFTSYSTNEIPWVGSGDDGTGSVAFEVQTAAQSSALGCGDPVTEAGTTTGKSCWLVILPRGEADNGSSTITQSGLFIDSWRHALSVKLGFDPLGSRCAEGAAERLLAGSELVSFAVNSWQPVVCNQEGASVYSLLTIPEKDALSAAATSDGAPLALTSYPLETDGDDPLEYAPVALTGVTISLAIDRRPDPFKEVPTSYLDAAGTPFSTVNLTPRLLAKLLSYSYRSSLPTGADTTYLNATNPNNITKDPDFLAVNDPEWAAQDLVGPAIADVIVPQGRSDAARAVWAYIAEDPDASDFLAGNPDPWGMKVNPWYSTNADENPTGAAFTTDRDDFPKADPIEYAPVGVGPINLVTWRPFASDLANVAYLTLRGDGQGPGFWDPNSVPPKYGKIPRMLPGSQALLGMTSSAAAARYQVVTASLRNPAGSFVAPTTAGMLAAADAMSTIDAAGKVRGFVADTEAARAAAQAYALSLPVYAAANPLMTDEALRSAYAGFIRYASGAGQTAGVDVGQLPAGYAPIPQSWAQQATAAADLIESGPIPAAQGGGGSTTYIPSQAPPASTRSSAGAAAAPVAAAAAESAPAATGSPSTVLSGGTTPSDPDIGPVAAAVPLSMLAGIAGAAAVPLTTRLRRRVL